MRFVGANPTPRIAGAAPRSATVNYLLGSDPKRWQTGLPTYSEIDYANLYPGVDLAYSVEGRPLKATYTVAPGADPGRIRWRYENGKSRVDEAGNLQVRLGSGTATLTEEAPLAWQEVDGRRLPVGARYAIAADGSVGFAVGEYDRGRPLILDPVITYSTFLGGQIADLAYAIAVDAAGNAYIAGYTASSTFPTVNPYQPSAAGQGDAFVAKFDRDGAPIYSTYLGGSYFDYATDIAADAGGNAYVTGKTGSVDFPVANALQPSYAGVWDAFVTKLNPTGSALVYSTYLGGSGEENYINAGVTGAIAVDSAGCAYLTGNTQSTDFPLAQPLQSTLRGSVDAFVTKLSADGSALVYSTYLGGDGGDTGWGIAVDSAGGAVLTGDTTSTNFPTVNAFQTACAPSYVGCWDVFVTRLDAIGTSLVFSTYLGGNDQEYVDRGIAVAVDAAGTAYVTGMTGSPDFPLLNPYQGFYGGQIDLFVAKFAKNGSLLSSTYLGGNNSDVGNGIAVDAARPRFQSVPVGGVHVSGLTISEDFPVVDPLQATLGAFEDAFVLNFTPAIDGLLFSTYLGGTNGREEYGSTGIGLDASGNVYVTGATEATDFPTVNPYQPSPHGSYDAFLTRIDCGCAARAGAPMPADPADPAHLAAVLYDQMDHPAGGDFTAQDFEAPFDLFDDQAADDFVVPAAAWSLDGVDVAGAYGNGPGPASGFNVFFYADAGGLPGALLASRLEQPFTGAAGNAAILLTSPVVLVAGTYWIAVQAHQEFGSNGQWFWGNRSVVASHPAAWENPGGGYSIGCTTWGVKTSCLSTQTGGDQLFRLQGTILAVVFADGFESGDTSNWSAAQP